MESENGQKGMKNRKTRLNVKIRIKIEQMK